MPDDAAAPPAVFLPLQPTPDDRTCCVPGACPHCGKVVAVPVWVDVGDASTEMSIPVEETSVRFDIDEHNRVGGVHCCRAAELRDEYRRTG